VTRAELVQAAYIVSAVLFIYGLRRLSHPATARSGNVVAAVGMAVAVVATLVDRRVADFGLIALGIIVGTIIGIPAARSVRMTAMPQMVALFNGVGGGAAALIAWTEFRHLAPEPGRIGLDTEIAILFSTVVGAVSFWGSIVAFMKLQELISGRPILLPGQQVVNALLLLATLAGCVYLALGFDVEAVFVGVLVLASVFGVALVLPIGGADMPVVISMLNAFTGLAAAAAGFALDNVALIVAGTLVGASGTILTRLMSEAMNRSIGNVLFAGFGAVAAGGAGAGAALASGDGAVRSTSPDDVAIQLAYANRVVIVPGSAWPWPRPSTPSASSPTSWRSGGSTSSTRSIPSRGACRAT
jgi:NAD(P) transhydrogenase subunit beta